MRLAPAARARPSPPQRAALRASSSRPTSRRRPPLRAEPRALLAGDGAEIMRDARRSVDAIKRELPGVSADKLVEMEPRMLFEDIGEGLAALRELWPEDAFRTSEAENPFFAEELALAIKALNGKGSETPRR